MVIEMYNKKNIKVPYINIKGQGLFYLGTNPLGLPISQLKSKVRVFAGMSSSGTVYKTVNGKKVDTGNRQFGYRIKPDQLIDFNKKSNYNIDTAAGINKLLNTPEAKKLIEINESKIKADTVIEKGKEFVKNNPDAIPVVADPVVLDKDINKIIEDTKGIKARFRYSDIVAKRKGAGVRSFKIIPAGAQDFSGLMYDLYGKGKKGEIQQKWVKENLIKPYQKGIAQIDNYRQAFKK